MGRTLVRYFSAFNDSSSLAYVSCQLVAAAEHTVGGSHSAAFDLEPGTIQVVTLQLASPLDSTGQAQLFRRDFLNVGNVGASYLRITAVQVGNLTTGG